MKILKACADTIRRERATSAMILVIVSVMALSFFFASRAAPVKSGAPAAAPAATEEIRRAGDQMLAELKKNEPLARKLSLAFLLVIASGFLADTLLVVGAREGILRRYFEPAGLRGPWRVGDVFKAFVFLVFSEIVISVGLGFVSALGLVGKGSGTVLLMGGTLARNVAAAAYIFYLVSRRYGLRLRELGLRANGWVRHAVLGLVAYVGFFPLYFMLLLGIMGVLKLTGYEPPLQTVVEVVYQEKNAGALAVASVVIAFLGPFFEELFFRGFVYQAFRGRWGVRWGMTAVSLLFAVLHAHWVAFVPIFALSVALCVLFETTGSLVPGILFHMSHNFVTLALMFQLKGFGAS